jgi:hypothetical protein
MFTKKSAYAVGKFIVCYIFRLRFFQKDSFGFKNYFFLWFQKYVKISRSNLLVQKKKPRIFSKSEVFVNFCLLFVDIYVIFYHCKLICQE